MTKEKNEYCGFSLFNDIEDLELKTRNRAVIMANIFKFNFINSILFSVFFISLPQLAYQMIFLMQSDAIALGFLSSSLAISIFINYFLTNNHPIKWIWFLVSSLLIMFVIACYQGLFFVPIVTFLAYLYSIYTNISDYYYFYFFEIYCYTGCEAFARRTPCRHESRT